MKAASASSRLRVAQVAPYDPVGGDGVSRAVLNLAQVLPSFGVDVEVWDFRCSAEAVSEVESKLCRVYRLPCYRSRLRGMMGLPPETRRFLADRKKRIDLLHLHSVFRPENHWAARLGVPFVVSPHNGYHSQLLKDHSRWKKLLAGLLWERANLNRAQRILALNERERQDVQAYGARVPLVSIPNLLDPEVLVQATVPVSLGTLWAFIGRLDVDVKGLDILLEAFARFRSSRRRRGSRLVIAGTDFRGGASRLRSMSEKFGIARCVDILGPKFGADKADLLMRTAVFLHPSRAEGLPNAVLEAMAYGRPVMLTPSTNLSEPVSKLRAGWVVQPTVESIARTFEDMAGASQEELAAAGSAAREFVRAEFGSEPIARRIASVYRETAR
jgi:glycosyltransferase involved in cell wall biosynthesis